MMRPGVGSLLSEAGCAGAASGARWLLHKVTTGHGNRLLGNIDGLADRCGSPSQCAGGCSAKTEDGMIAIARSYFAIEGG